MKENAAIIESKLLEKTQKMVEMKDNFVKRINDLESANVLLERDLQASEEIRTSLEELLVTAEEKLK